MPGKKVLVTNACVLPDASLVQPIDRNEAQISTNEDLIEELLNTRRQRDVCAARIDGLRQWRESAERDGDDN